MPCGPRVPRSRRHLTSAFAMEYSMSAKTNIVTRNHLEQRPPPAPLPRVSPSPVAAVTGPPLRSPSSRTASDTASDLATPALRAARADPRSRRRAVCVRGIRGSDAARESPSCRRSATNYGTLTDPKLQPPPPPVRPDSRAFPEHDDPHAFRCPHSCHPVTWITRCTSPARGRGYRVPPLPRFAHREEQSASRPA